ncbi:hypothetical protein OCAR_4958 [Afipia carboxidovorans OM5]|nr:hypothetical protein OCAR_4958 [Afipia carboxidovorans OM5]
MHNSCAANALLAKQVSSRASLFSNKAMAIPWMTWLSDSMT